MSFAEWLAYAGTTPPSPHEKNGWRVRHNIEDNLLILGILVQVLVERFLVDFLWKVLLVTEYSYTLSGIYGVQFSFPHSRGSADYIPMKCQDAVAFETFQRVNVGATLAIAWIMVWLSVCV